MALVRNKSHGTILLPQIGKAVKPGGEVEITDEEFEKIKGILLEFKRLGIIDIVKATHVIKLALEEQNGELTLRPLEKPDEVIVETNFEVGEQKPELAEDPEQLPAPSFGTVIEFSEGSDASEVPQSSDESEGNDAAAFEEKSERKKRKK